jgi:hypothetical protein
MITEGGKMKIENLVCCSWHKPRNAIVELASGRIVPEKTLSAIPASPQKEHMMFSGGMCDPCAREFVHKYAPKSEGIFKTSDS